MFAKEYPRLGRWCYLLSFVTAVAAATLALAATSSDERRVALVIGNGNYTDFKPLNNPVHDAEDIAAKLEELGFDVVLGLDLDMDSFGERVSDFSDKLEGADVSMLFYAGHGLQVDGVNYVLPVDSGVTSRAQLDFQAVKVDTIIGIMDERSQMSLIFLDACRDNPLTRSLTRSAGAPAGLAEPIELGTGTFVAYATAPGNVALDGDGQRNSPFTTALLRNIDRPNIDIRLMMSDVREEVYNQTQMSQRPWDNNTLIGRFYFRQAAVETEAPPPDPEQIEFEKARNAGSVVAFEEFLGQYPNGRFSEQSRKAVSLLLDNDSDLSLDELFWRTMRASVLPDEFTVYLSLFPNGEFADLAKDRIELLERAQEISGFEIDGQPLSSRSELRRAALERADDLPPNFIQYGLIALGFPIQDPAGVIDGPTRRAIRAYQASVGAEQTGLLSPWQTVDVLLNAAAVGDQHAETAIGIMHAGGLGFENDDRVARLWLQRAADKGDMHAQANLAVLLRDGRGGVRDVDGARDLLEAAQLQGLPQAETLLQALDG